MAAKERGKRANPPISTDVQRPIPHNRAYSVGERLLIPPADNFARRAIDGSPQPNRPQNPSQPRPSAIALPYLTVSPQGNHRASPTPDAFRRLGVVRPAVLRPVPPPPQTPRQPVFNRLS